MTHSKEVLNTGEIADSLMNETGDKSFSKFIIPLFEKQDRHKVLFFFLFALSLFWMVSKKRKVFRYIPIT